MALTVEQGGRIWQIDLTVWLHDLHQNVTRWHEVLRERITAEQRGAVLRIKNDWHRRPEYPQQVGGLEICTAVIDGGVRTPEQLPSWLAQHGRPATQPYRPPARCRHARETPRRLHANSGM